MLDGSVNGKYGGRDASSGYKSLGHSRNSLRRASMVDEGLNGGYYS